MGHRLCQRLRFSTNLYVPVYIQKSCLIYLNSRKINDGKYFIHVKQFMLMSDIYNTIPYIYTEGL